MLTCRHFCIHCIGRFVNQPSKGHLLVCGSKVYAEMCTVFYVLEDLCYMESLTGRVDWIYTR